MVGSRGPWRNIIAVINNFNNIGIVFDNLCSKQVGNGLNTLFWKEKWCGDEIFKDRFPRIFALESNKDSIIADRIGTNGFKWNWRREVRGGREEAELNDLQNIIGHTSLNESSDKWRWNLNPNGDFDTNYLRKEIEKANLGFGSHKTRWNKILPAKINIFFWRAQLNRIPCKERLISMGIDLDNALCPLCNSEVETVNHLLFSCSWAKEIWTKINRWWDFAFSGFTSLETALTGIDSTRMNSQLHKTTEAIFMTTCYSIWCFRNRFIFESSKPRLSELFDFIVEKSFSWVILRCKESRKNIVDWRISPRICLVLL